MAGAVYLKCFRNVLLITMMTNIEAEYQESPENAPLVIVLANSDQIKELIPQNDDDDDDIIPQNDDDYDFYPNTLSKSSGYYLESKMLRLGDIDVYANIEEEKKKFEDAKLVKKQHERKMKEITNYMKDHMISTNYFYDEMKRILRQRMVKNGLRKMVEYLEKPENSDIKKKVMDCFLYHRKKQAREYDVWKHPTNNLVINTVKDPYNDGFLN